jgi:thymidylate synthase (FAD)
VNEYSTRYSVAIDGAQKTPPNGWRLQDGINKQGSSGAIDIGLGAKLSRREAEFQELSREIYRERLDSGVAREQARKDLPLSTYTEAYWKIDLWNLLHFLSLRMDAHAQTEIRAYATLIGYEIVAKWVPFVWEAFLEYRLNAVHLSATEVTIVSHLLNGDLEMARTYAASLGWLERDSPDGGLRRNRERDEFVDKLDRKFTFSIDWLGGPTAR